MSVEALKKQTGVTQAAQQTKSLTVFDMLSKYKDQIALALPRHLSADRMVRIAMTEIRKNPKLGKCTPESLMGSVIMLSQLGLEPGVMGQAYLIPYEDKRAGTITCTAVPGWQGIIDLVSRSGRAVIHTDAVRDGDDFTYEKGSSPFIRHIEKSDGTPAFTHVYAVGRVRGSEFPVIEVWTRAKVSAHLKQYNRVGDRHYAKENENNFEMYGRKCCALQVAKYVPKSVELQQAADLSYSADSGTQLIGVTEAIAGTFDASNSYPTIEAGDRADKVASAKVEELFGLNATSVDQRTALLSEFADDEAGLIDHLENELSRAES